MEDTWHRSIPSRGAAEGDAIWTSTLIATIVSTFVVIFAVITQLLAWIGAITLSTSQQVTIWLVVLGLIVLLWIAYIACRAYVTVKMHETSVAGPHVEPESRKVEPQGGPRSQELEPQDEPKSQEAKLATNPSDEPPPLRSVPPTDEIPGDGSRLSVSMADVFPHGCYLVLDSISEAEDYDESIEARPVVDKGTGQRVYQCRVMDLTISVSFLVAPAASGRHGLPVTH
jgi:hypothetical protein